MKIEKRKGRLLIRKYLADANGHIAESVFTTAIVSVPLSTDFQDSEVIGVEWICWEEKGDE